MILDLFAGPGGWSEGLRALGHADIGIEWDGAACETRAAAGHLTIRADVATYPTEPFARRVVGLIASPPCPTFSAAGKGEGVNEFPYLHSFADQVAATGWFSPWSHHAWSDPRTPLVLEPLRWVEALQPEWVACEQVHAVMPLWAQYAAIWRAQGYSTWAGVLNAADFGVPQTRRRAFCIAHRSRVATPPEPTHCKGGALTAFGSLLPWVSMADALGWGMTEKPSVTLVAGSNRQGGADPLDGGSGARATLRRERERERRIMVATRGDSGREQDEFDAMKQPSRTLTGKTDSWTVDRRTNSRGAGGGAGADGTGTDV